MQNSHLGHPAPSRRADRYFPLKRGWKSVLAISLLSAGWAAGMTKGFTVLWDYSSTPGDTATAPSHWPRRSALPAPVGHPTVVLFLHPKCPCSHATVAELTEIVTRAGPAISVLVVVLNPEGQAKAWADTELIRAVAKLPGVTVWFDQDNAEARSFHALTSGETYVYDADRRLRFHGGITGARGHIGINPGREAVEAVARSGATGITTTSIFGCPLQAPAVPSNLR